MYGCTGAASLFQTRLKRRRWLRRGPVVQVEIKGRGMPLFSPVCHTSARNIYWSLRQQLAHHTVTGCRMRPGDLCGTGTISGRDDSSLGSMLELSWNR